MSSPFSRQLVGSNEHAERAMEMVLESERKLSESKEQLRKLRLNVNLMIRNIQDVGHSLN